MLYMYTSFYLKNICIVWMSPHYLVNVRVGKSFSLADSVICMVNVPDQSLYSDQFLTVLVMSHCHFL